MRNATEVVQLALSFTGDVLAAVVIEESLTESAAEAHPPLLGARCGDGGLARVAPVPCICEALP